MNIINFLPKSLFENKKNKEKSLSVAFILYDDFIFEYLTDFLYILNKYQNKYYDDGFFKKTTWSIIGENTKPLRSSCNIVMQPNAGFEKPSNYDYIIIIGSSSPQSQVVDNDTLNFIFLAHKHRVPLVGIASGSKVLECPQLLSSRKCAVDGEIINGSTSSGVVELASTLLSQHFGEEYPTIAPISERHDISVKKAIEYMESNISMPVSTTTLASNIGIKVAQLERAFWNKIGKTPSKVWRKIRLDRAYWLLENTDENITNIALECGYYDSAHFSNAFKSSFSFSPNKMRSDNVLCEQKR